MDTIEYDGKKRNVIKYEIDLTKSFDKLGFSSFLRGSSDTIKKYDLKKSFYYIYIDPKTKKVVGFDILSSMNTSEDMQITYRADPKATFEEPTNLE